MKICIDARWVKEKIAGIGRYTVYLLRYLTELDTENDYLILFQDESICRRVSAETGLDRFPRFSTRILPCGVFSPQSQFVLPGLLRREKVDLFHSTNFMAPLTGFGGKLILTIHDIIPLKFPEYAPQSKKTRLFLLYKALMKWLVTIAEVIITDSAHSRRDILEFFNLPGEKVRVIYLGVDPKYRPLSPDKCERVRREYAIRDRLALFAGRADPYKNLLTLVKAAETLNTGGEIHCTVIVAGERDRRYREVEEYLVANRLQDDVIFAGSLGEDRLIPLYNAADVFVHPSHYEGFGLPPLEAMACGTPVICSNRSSLPEVVGDAGILIDPLDVTAFTAQMRRVFTDTNLAARLRAAGLERATRFPWKTTAARTLALYRDLSGKSDGGIQP